MKAVLMTLSLALPLASIAAEPAQQADSQKEVSRAQRTSDGPKTTAEKPESPPSTVRRSPSASRSGDRLDLDTTVVTGNRELPKVLYIVPWKKADIGDLPAQPFNTLLDEALTPVDRDVFRREVTYYGAVSAGADSTNPANTAPAAGPEK
jgi:hypothetical protein